MNSKGLVHSELGTMFKHILARRNQELRFQNHSNISQHQITNLMDAEYRIISYLHYTLQLLLHMLQFPRKTFTNTLKKTNVHLNKESSSLASFQSLIKNFIK